MSVRSTLRRMSRSLDVLCEEARGLRQDFGQSREMMLRAEEERADRYGAEQALGDKTLAALSVQLEETVGLLRQDLNVIEVALIRAEEERTKQARASETHADDRTRLLVDALEAVSQKITDGMTLLQQELALTREAITQISAGEANRPVVADSEAQVSALPSSSQSSTVYFFQLGQGEELPDLDALTTAYAASRMAGSKGGAANEP